MLEHTLRAHFSESTQKLVRTAKVRCEERGLILVLVYSSLIRSVFEYPPQFGTLVSLLNLLPQGTTVSHGYHLRSGSLREDPAMASTITPYRKIYFIIIDIPSKMFHDNVYTVQTRKKHPKKRV